MSSILDEPHLIEGWACDDFSLALQVIFKTHFSEEDCEKVPVGTWVFEKCLPRDSFLLPNSQNQHFRRLRKCLAGVASRFANPVSRVGCTFRDTNLLFCVSSSHRISQLNFDDFGDCSNIEFSLYSKARLYLQNISSCTCELQPDAARASLRAPLEHPRAGQSPSTFQR